MRTKGYLIVYCHSSQGTIIYGNMTIEGENITSDYLHDIRQKIAKSLQAQYSIDINPDEIIILNIITLG